MAAEAVAERRPADNGPVLLACVEVMRAQANKAEAGVLVDIAAWAVVRTAETALPFAPLPGQERALRVGGSGTPVVGEFLAAELSSHLRLGPFAASTLLADAMTLTHRMPRLMELARTGRVDVWRVRMAASAGRGLRRDACRRLDAYLSTTRPGASLPPVATMNRPRLTALLEQLGLVQDDDENSETETELALAHRHVRIEHGLDGTAEVRGLLSSADAERLDARLDAVAADLAEDEHDERSADVRRSVALGQLALAGTGTGAGTTAPPVTLFLHLDHTSGTWSMDGVGPVSQTTADLAVAGAVVTVKPVVDLADDVTYTGYVAPTALRERLALVQRDTCCFPWCDRPAHLARRGRADYDHRVPHQRGGPTSAANGQLLCRYHHRVKTHGRWRSEAVGDGGVRWTTPDGRRFDVRAGRTTPLRT